MRKKLEHWWTYYKGVVIFAVVLAAAVLYVADTMGKKEKTQILMGEVVNNVQDDAVTTQMEEAILAGIGGDPNGEEVVVDTALTMDAAALGQTPIADANTQDSLATITTYVYAHELDFMILEKDVFDYYCNLNAFADLGELLGAGACEALGARMRHHTDRYRVCEAVRDYALRPGDRDCERIREEGAGGRDAPVDL